MGRKGRPKREKARQNVIFQRRGVVPAAPPSCLSLDMTEKRGLRELSTFSFRSGFSSPFPISLYSRAWGAPPHFFPITSYFLPPKAPRTGNGREARKEEGRGNREKGKPQGLASLGLCLWRLFLLALSVLPKSTITPDFASSSWNKSFFSKIL